MKKIYFLFILSFCAIFFGKPLVYCQVNAYSFAASSGTYTPITGGTQINLSIPDSYTSGAITLSPAFTFNGVSYTQAFMTSNGLITLGGSAPSNIEYNAVANTTGSGIAICPFNADLQASSLTGAAAEMRFETVGNEHVFQWTDAMRYAFGDRISIQARLNTVTGTIVFVYGGTITVGTSSTRQPIVGIRSSSSDYKNLKVGSGAETWAAPLAGTSTSDVCRFTSTSPAQSPVAGQTYTWTPPAACSGLPVAGTAATTTTATVCAGASATITLTGTTVASGLSYQWQSAVAGSGVWNNIVSATSTSLLAILPNASTDYRCVVTCAAVSQSANSNTVTINVNPATYATVPFTESFENTWIDGCGAAGSKSIPNSNWRNTPFTGNNSWRRNDETTANSGWSSTNGSYSPAASAGTYSARIHTYSTSSSGNFDLFLNCSAGAVTKQITYDYINTSGSDSLKVFFSTDGGNNFTFIGNKNTTAAAWSSILIPFTSSSATTVIRFTAYGDAGSTDIGIDNIAVSVVACGSPTAVNVSAITTTAATVSWTAPGAAPNSYELYYSTTSTAPTAGTTPLVTNITGTTTNLSTLAPATTYYVWVRSNCGGPGTSSWISGGTFVTLCVPVGTLNENFDGVTTPNLPTCWSKIIRGTTVSSFATVGSSTTYANSGTKSIEFYNSSSGSTDDIMLVSPQLTNLNAGTYRLRFYAKNTTASEDIQVGTVDNTSSTAVFTPITTVDVTTTFQLFTVNFTAYSGSNQYIALRRLNTSTYTYVYVDDIVWEAMPLCNEPTAVVASAITTTGATIGWTAPATAPSSYELYYNTTSTAPTAGTTPLVTNITGTTTNLGTLAPATTYYVWVRSNCGGSGTSGWSIVSSFVTLCIPASTLNENFDGVTTPNLPTCWSKIIRGTTVSSFATVGSSTSYANSGTKSIDLYNSSSGASDDIILVSPQLTNLNAGTYRLRFYAKNTTASEDIQVGTVDNTSSTAVFTPITTVDVTTTFQQFTVSFAAYSGSNQYIALRRLNTSTYTDVYVDDIVWEAIPLCNEPTAVVASAITTTGATIGWTAPATAPNSYELYYSTTNTAPTAGTTPLVTNISGTTTNLSTLTPSATYFVWVRSNCGGSGTSAWSIAGTFNTACSSVAVPYTQNFDAVTAPALPPCISVLDVNADGKTWTPTSNSSYLIGGTNSMTYTWNSASAADDWFFTAPLTLTGGVQYTLKFAAASYTSSYFEKLEVKYGSSATVAGMTSSALYSNTALQGPAKVQVPFTPATTGTYYLGFHAFSIANQFFLSVDSILVDLSSNLPIVLNSFKGERQGANNILSWSTATETNNTGFELQRSADGVNFSQLAFVPSKASNGNSNAALTYTFTDTKSLIAGSFYRLKQIDKDGKSTLSQVVFIKGIKANKLELVSVYPNPVVDNLNIALVSPKADNVTFVVSDLSGKVIVKQNASVNNGDNNIKVNVSNLAKGTYTIKAICADGCETAISKFVKQ